jgi:HD superfamily phosphohydrolase YqeK
MAARGQPSTASAWRQKPGASRLDLVVFVADKLEWDQPTQKMPYRANLLAGLAHSLEKGALAYLDYLWRRRSCLACIHHWMVAAYHELLLKYA